MLPRLGRRPPKHCRSVRTEFIRYVCVAQNFPRKSNLCRSLLCSSCSATRGVGQNVSMILDPGALQHGDVQIPRKLNLSCCSASYPCPRISMLYARGRGTNPGSMMLSTTLRYGARVGEQGPQTSVKFPRGWMAKRRPCKVTSYKQSLVNNVKQR